MTLLTVVAPEVLGQKMPLLDLVLNERTVWIDGERRYARRFSMSKYQIRAIFVKPDIELFLAR
jgi:hypothetical protein